MMSFFPFSMTGPFFCLEKNFFFLFYTKQTSSPEKTWSISESKMRRNTTPKEEESQVEMQKINIILCVAVIRRKTGGKFGNKKICTKFFSSASSGTYFPPRGWDAWQILLSKEKVKENKRKFGFTSSSRIYFSPPTFFCPPVGLKKGESDFMESESKDFYCGENIVEY